MRKPLMQGCQGMTKGGSSSWPFEAIQHHVSKARPSCLPECTRGKYTSLAIKPVWCHASLASTDLRAPLSPHAANRRGCTTSPANCPQPASHVCGHNRCCMPGALLGMLTVGTRRFNFAGSAVEKDAKALSSTLEHSSRPKRKRLSRQNRYFTMPSLMLGLIRRFSNRCSTLVGRRSRTPGKTGRATSTVRVRTWVCSPTPATEKRHARRRSMWAPSASLSLAARAKMSPLRPRLPPMSPRRRPRHPVPGTPARVSPWADITAKAQKKSSPRRAIPTDQAAFEELLPVRSWCRNLSLRWRRVLGKPVRRCRMHPHAHTGRQPGLSATGPPTQRLLWGEAQTSRKEASPSAAMLSPRGPCLSGSSRQGRPLPGSPRRGRRKLFSPKGSASTPRDDADPDLVGRRCSCHGGGRGHSGVLGPRAEPARPAVSGGPPTGGTFPVSLDAGSGEDDASSAPESLAALPDGVGVRCAWQFGAAPPSAGATTPQPMSGAGLPEQYQA